MVANRRLSKKYRRLCGTNYKLYQDTCQRAQSLFETGRLWEASSKLSDAIDMRSRCSSAALSKSGVKLIDSQPSDLHSEPDLFDLLFLRHFLAAECRQSEDVARSLSFFEDEAEVRKGRERILSLFGVAQAWSQMNRHQKASAVAEEALEELSLLLKDKAMATVECWVPVRFPFAARQDSVLEQTELEKIQETLCEMKSHGTSPPKADGLCCFSFLLSPAPHSQKDIYFSDLDFKGMYRLTCSASCHLEYHATCFKALTEPDTGYQSLQEVGTTCPTPDCSGVLLMLQFFDREGSIKHQKQLPADQLKKIQSAKNGKVEEEPEVVTERNKRKRGRSFSSNKSSSSTGSHQSKDPEQKIVSAGGGNNHTNEQQRQKTISTDEKKSGANTSSSPVAGKELIFSSSTSRAGRKELLSFNASTMTDPEEGPSKNKQLLAMIEGLLEGQRSLTHQLVTALGERDDALKKVEKLEADAENIPSLAQSLVENFEELEQTRNQLKEAQEALQRERQSAAAEIHRVKALLVAAESRLSVSNNETFEAHKEWLQVKEELALNMIMRHTSDVARAMATLKVKPGITEEKLNVLTECRKELKLKQNEIMKTFRTLRDELKSRAVSLTIEELKQRLPTLDPLPAPVGSLIIEAEKPVSVPRSRPPTLMSAVPSPSVVNSIRPSVLTPMLAAKRGRTAMPGPLPVAPPAISSSTSSNPFSGRGRGVLVIPEAATPTSLSGGFPSSAQTRVSPGNGAPAQTRLSPGAPPQTRLSPRNGASSPPKNGEKKKTIQEILRESFPDVSSACLLEFLGELKQEEGGLKRFKVAEELIAAIRGIMDGRECSICLTTAQGEDAMKIRCCQAWHTSDVARAMATLKVKPGITEEKLNVLTECRKELKLKQNEIMKTFRTLRDELKSRAVSLTIEELKQRLPTLDPLPAPVGSLIIEAEKPVSVPRSRPPTLMSAVPPPSVVNSIRPSVLTPMLAAKRGRTAMPGPLPVAPPAISSSTSSNPFSGRGRGVLVIPEAATPTSLSGGFPSSAQTRVSPGNGAPAQTRLSPRNGASSPPKNEEKKKTIQEILRESFPDVSTACLLEFLGELKQEEGGLKRFKVTEELIAAIRGIMDGRECPICRTTAQGEDAMKIRCCRAWYHVTHSEDKPGLPGSSQVTVCDKLKLLLDHLGNSSYEEVFPELEELSPEFSQSQIRILLFGKSQKVIFDSSILERVSLEVDAPASNTFCRIRGLKKKGLGPSSRPLKDEFIELNDKFGYKKCPMSSSKWNYMCEDKQVCDLVFGTVGMTTRGASFKVHSCQDHSVLILSKVFVIQKKMSHENSFGDASSVTGSSFDSLFCSSSRLDSFDNSSRAMSREPSLGSMPSFSQVNSVDSCLGSSCQTGSLQSGTTAGPPEYPPLEPLAEHGEGQSFALVPSTTVYAQQPPPSRCSTDDSILSRASSNSLGTAGHSSIRLAFAVQVDLSNDEGEKRHFESFLFSNMAVMERLLLRMQLDFTFAYRHYSSFNHAMFTSTKELQDSLFQLYTCPRIPRLSWFSLLSAAYAGSGNEVSSFASGSLEAEAQQFLDVFHSVVKEFERKQTNFFFSTLLSAVLRYHLGWTSHSLKSRQPVIVNPDPPPSPSPLTAQLRDLCGGERTEARTYLTPSSKAHDLLRCLSYFYRCRLVSEKLFRRGSLESPPTPRPSTLHPLEGLSRCPSGASTMTMSSKKSSSIFTAVATYPDLGLLCETQEAPWRDSPPFRESENGWGDSSSGDRGSGCLYPRLPSDTASNDRECRDSSSRDRDSCSREKEPISSIYPRLPLIDNKQETSSSLYPTITPEMFDSRLPSLARSTSDRVQSPPALTTSKQTLPEKSTRPKSCLSSVENISGTLKRSFSQRASSSNLVLRSSSEEKENADVSHLQPTLFVQGRRLGHRKHRSEDIKSSVPYGQSQVHRDQKFSFGSDACLYNYSCGAITSEGFELVSHGMSLESYEPPPVKQRPRSKGIKVRDLLVSAKRKIREVTPPPPIFLFSKTGSGACKTKDPAPQKPSFVIGDDEGRVTPPKLLASPIKLWLSPDEAIAPTREEEVALGSSVLVRNVDVWSMATTNIQQEKREASMSPAPSTKKLETPAEFFLKAERRSMPKSVFVGQSPPLSSSPALALLGTLAPSYCPGSILTASILSSCENPSNGVAHVRSKEILPLYDRIRRDLIACAKAERAVGDDVVCIIGDIKNCEVQILPARGSLEIEMASPLVSAILEGAASLCETKEHPLKILSFLESSLESLISRAETMASYLIHSRDIQSMENLISSMEISRNDVPLLLTVAQSIAPELRRMYGLGKQ
ncbi:unnamed protein product [Cyprideis torosa]|uniref:RING-type E3 ubiquitin transferase n=1 Tax=Cyprideis torosa TaxID=163714 RepID=A0A7R8W0T3_9CRUS|nr:unnamed protein product [Cyprideis torosa]CAG0879098.1 unnamed protein product [Cyprideis torosa]